MTLWLDLLDEARQKAGLNWKQLAELAGFQQSFMSKLKRGSKQRMDTSRIEPLADALRLTGFERERFVEAAYMEHCPAWVRSRWDEMKRLNVEQAEAIGSLLAENAELKGAKSA